jgi:hypothetical protein
MREAGYAMRIGVMAFVLPIWAVATGFFLLEEMYLYAGLMSFFGIIMGYGIYMNWKRISSHERIDDERMKKINWRSGANAFWTMINTAIIFGIFGGLITDFLPLSQAQLMKNDAAVILFAGFLAYFGFRIYYLRYGLGNEFWRFD